MKKYIVSFGIISIAFITLGFREYDMVPGIDLTGKTNVTGSMLYQLVGNAVINTNKGLVIVSDTKPNVTDNPRYTNFLWFDKVTFTLKYYVGPGDSVANWFPTIGVGVIQSSNIANYAVQAINLGTNSVQEYAIAAGAVTSTKINDGQIVLGKIGPAAVTNGNIAHGAITFDKIQALTIQTTNIADGSITAEKLAAGAISSFSLTNNSVTSDKLATNAVLNYHLNANIIQGSNIVDGVLTSNKIAGQTINNSLLNTNTLYGLAKAWAFCNSDGTLLKGFNIASVEKPANGYTTFIFGGNFVPGDTNYVVTCSAISPSGINVAVRYLSNLTTRVTVRVVDLGASSENTPISIVIYDF